MNKQGDIRDIIVTGGAGYLGSETVGFLANQNHRIFIFDCLLWGDNSLKKLKDLKNIELIKSDISNLDSDSIKILKNCDTVIHLAAIVGEPHAKQIPDETMVINYEATKMLYNLAAESKVKTFIFASTCSNYGEIPSSDTADESYELKPLGVYAESKVLAEKFLMKQNNDINLIICRLSTLFGMSARPRFDLTINHFTRDAYYKKEILIYDSDTVRPYIHVSDAARVLSMLVQKSTDKINDRLILNIGDNRFNLSKKQIIDIILDYLPETKIAYSDKSIDRRNYSVSFDKLNKTLPDFDTTVTPEQSVASFIEIFDKCIIEDPFDLKYSNHI
jgi:nucleoside-diphosphate-sugar epimerase